LKLLQEKDKLKRHLDFEIEGEVAMHSMLTNSKGVVVSKVQEAMGVPNLNLSSLLNKDKNVT
jgi:hypothetical protein